MNRFALRCGAALLMLVAWASPAFAHLHDEFGGIAVSVGWTDEPSFAGLPNAVQIILTEGHHEGGESGEHAHEEGAETPVDPKKVKLRVEVIFGDKNGAQKKEPMPLEPFSFGSPGEFRSEAFVPSRPGTYTFHVFGSLDGRKLDKFYTSGEKGAIEGSQYHHVREVGPVAFPERDPSNRDLAQAVQQLKRDASSAKDDAGLARTLGIVGAVLGAVAVVSILLRGRKGAS